MRKIFYFASLAFLLLSSVSYSQNSSSRSKDWGINARGDTVALDVLPTFEGNPVSELRAWVQRNVENPSGEFEGVVQLQFNLSPDGSITDPQVLESPHPYLAQAALRTLYAAPKCEPGKNGEEAVTVPMVLSVTFFRPDATTADLFWEAKARESTDKLKDLDQPLEKIDVMPKFRGGSGEKFRDWVTRHLEYPEEMYENGFQGVVVVCFVVERDGMVSNVTLEEGSHPQLSQEALRTVAQSPRWTPGIHQGEKVRVRYRLPIIFRF